MENPDFKNLPVAGHYHEPMFELPQMIVSPASISNKAIVITLGGETGEPDSCWDIPGVEFKEVEV
jgi:hypothetical protein